jgi:predicted nucleotidyltransferase
MVKDKAIIINKIKKYIKALEKNITIHKVILYGSWASGKPDEFSDIDLAIFSPDFGKHKLKELQLLSKLSWEIDESIEAIPYSSDTLFTQNPKNFVYKIIKTGKTIYNRSEKHPDFHT